VRRSDEDVWRATGDNTTEGGGELQEGQKESAGHHG
jgi:hypothetical protein